MDFSPWSTHLSLHAIRWHVDKPPIFTCLERGRTGHVDGKRLTDGQERRPENAEDYHVSHYQAPNRIYG